MLAREPEHWAASSYMACDAPGREALLLGCCAAVARLINCDGSVARSIGIRSGTAGNKGVGTGNGMET